MNSILSQPTNTFYINPSHPAHFRKLNLNKNFSQFFLRPGSGREGLMIKKTKWYISLLQVNHKSQRNGFFKISLIILIKYLIEISFLCAGKVSWITKLLNPIQDVGGDKTSPYQFSPVISPNIGFSPQNSLTFSFNPFATPL